MTVLAAFITIAAMAQGMDFMPEGTTLEQASERAKAENKLIFLDCFTQWCGPCKMMSKTIFPTEQVGEYMNPRFVCVKMDMETEYGAALAKKLQVQAYPTFVFFNSYGQEIGRFLGACKADEFIAKVKEASTDNSASALADRWKAGDRDPKFLMNYLATLTAAYKADDADQVAEALLDGKETSFAADSTLRTVFMRNINNPFAKAFVSTVKDPSQLAAQVGQGVVDMKIANVLQNYNRGMVVEKDGSYTIDQKRFDDFKALLADMKVANADHYTLSSLITLAEKQGNLDDYLKYVKEYLANPSLDADDMQLAKWAKPFSGANATDKQKKQMKSILANRIKEIKSGKRQAMTKIGNMILSRPTDDLLSVIIKAIDGEMPGK